jgi:enterochelin esterase family protein
MKLRALLLLLPLTAAVQAQQPSQPPAVRSPEVAADRRITFRVRAPDASKVTVFCECLSSEPALAKGADGVWSVTVGPVEPDIYEYHFTVDGIDNLDQRNPVGKIQQPAESHRERRRGPRDQPDVL